MIIVIIALLPIVVATAAFDLVVLETENGMKKIGSAIVHTFHKPKPVVAAPAE